MSAGLNACVATRPETKTASSQAVPSLSSIFSDRPAERIAAGTAMFWEGDEARHVYEIMEGTVRIFRIIGDGRRAITGFLYPGDILGVSIRDRHLFCAEAVNAVKVRRFSTGAFQQAINMSPELRPQLFAHMCDEMAGAQEQMVLLSRKNAEERICTFLLSLHRKFADESRATRDLHLPMTRLDIADYLGLTIETVSRTFSSLISRGVIGQSGRHDVSIRKFDALVRLSGNGEFENEGMRGQPIYAQQAVWPS